MLVLEGKDDNPHYHLIVSYNRSKNLREVMHDMLWTLW
jgi:hypothetical protein